MLCSLVFHWFYWIIILIFSLIFHDYKPLTFTLIFINLILTLKILFSENLYIQLLNLNSLFVVIIILFYIPRRFSYQWNHWISWKSYLLRKKIIIEIEIQILDQIQIQKIFLRILTKINYQKNKIFYISVAEHETLWNINWYSFNDNFSDMRYLLWRNRSRRWHYSSSRFISSISRLLFLLSKT